MLHSTCQGRAFVSTPTTINILLPKTWQIGMVNILINILAATVKFCIWYNSNTLVAQANYHEFGPSYKEILRTWLKGRSDFIINRRAKLKPDLESAAQNLYETR